ncbi:unnamed protein product [Polarella glacialis]|uniref:Uncharacterized protein n=1 Tax=Polarella glacialis TaxID=89957 RepID=A0A813M3W3_POLGL|nr:unnamed protein product [Polarella glacialis]
MFRELSPGASVMRVCICTLLRLTKLPAILKIVAPGTPGRLQSLHILASGKVVLVRICQNRFQLSRGVVDRQGDYSLTHASALCSSLPFESDFVQGVRLALPIRWIFGGFLVEF